MGGKASSGLRVVEELSGGRDGSSNSYGGSEMVRAGC